MPAEEVASAFCAQYQSSWYVTGSMPRGSSTPSEYTVTWNMLGAHCTCPSFRYSGDSGDQHCKHVDKVWKQGCFWNPQWYDGGTRDLSPDQLTTDTLGDDYCCPKCDGPMIGVRIAV